MTLAEAALLLPLLSGISPAPPAAVPPAEALLAEPSQAPRSPRSERAAERAESREARALRRAASVDLTARRPPLKVDPRTFAVWPLFGTLKDGDTGVPYAGVLLRGSF